MWASAVLGSPGSDTELSSPKINLADKICFTFWLDMTVWIHLYLSHHFQIPIIMLKLFDSASDWDRRTCDLPGERGLGGGASEL